jgi:hypothetical protein
VRLTRAAWAQRFDDAVRLSTEGKTLLEYEEVASEVLTGNPLAGYSPKQRAQLDAFASSLMVRPCRNRRGAAPLAPLLRPPRPPAPRAADARRAPRRAACR